MKYSYTPDLTYDENRRTITWIEEECEPENVPAEELEAAKTEWQSAGFPLEDLGYVDRVVWVFPAKFEICDDCDGRGRTLNENLRGAFTQSEFYECFDDEESQAEYWRGGDGIYGVECKTCGGKRVQMQIDGYALEPIDETNPTFQQRAYIRFRAACDDARRWDRAARREQEMEARMLGEWDGD